MSFVSTERNAWEVRGAARGGLYAYDEPPAGAGVPGAGTVHHVAWASQDEEHAEWQRRVSEAGMRATPVIDRFWFKSVDFRQPSGVLFELATLGPGFGVDEDPAPSRRGADPAACVRAPPRPGRADADTPPRPTGAARVSELVARRRDAAGEPGGALAAHGRGVD